MPLKINVGATGAARDILNEVFPRADNNNAPNNVAGQPGQQPAAQAERPGDGLLMRTLKQVARKVSLEAGPSHADCLSDVVAGKSVNLGDLGLVHDDEVDGGVSTRAMDDDWVEVDFASELLKDKEDPGKESAAAAAKRTMAELEHVSTVDVRAVYENFLVRQQANLGGGEEPARLEDFLANAEQMPNPEGSEAIAAQNKIVAAVKAQLKLADELRGIAFEQKEPDPQLLEAANRSQRCAEALVDLVAKVGTDSVKEANVLKALDREMQSEREGLQMPTETVVRVFDAQLADLNRLYDNLSSEGRVVTADEFERLETGLAKARKMLKDAQDGVSIKSGDDEFNLLNVDKEVLRRIEKEIGEMSGRVEQLKVESLKIASQEIYNQFSFDLLKSPFFDEKYSEYYLAKYCENKGEGKLTEMKNLVKGFREGLQNLKEALDRGLKTGQMNEAKEAARELCNLFCDIDPYGRLKYDVIEDYIRKAQLDLDLRENLRIQDISLDRRQQITGQISSLGSSVGDRQRDVLIDRLADMGRIVRGGNVPVVKGDLLTKVMDGSCGFSTAALAIAWGETSVEPGIDDRYLVSSKRLGNGFCNTVKLCSYRQPDGTTLRRVFKPEVPARESLGGQNVDAYDSIQKVAALNIAVRQMAEQFGFDDLIVNAHTGVHGGQFGLMMELADGASGGSIGDSFSAGDANKLIGQKTVGEVKRILDENGHEAQKLLGNLRHAFTDLDWFDHIVGQTDRNKSNYMISIGDDLSVSLKGIDNDLSFSPNEESKSDDRAYPPVISENMYNRLHEFADEINSRDEAGVRQWLREEKKLDGLTDKQLDKTADRIKKAWARANSENCTVIRNDNPDQWGDADLMQQHFETCKTNHCLEQDYFMRDVLQKDMFFRAGLSNNFFPALNGSEINRVSRERFGCMQEVMNRSDELLEKKIPGPAKEGDQSVSVAELKAFFTVWAKNPLTAARVVDPWPESGNKDAVLSAMVEAYRKVKNELAVSLQAANIMPENEEFASYMQVFLAGDFGELTDVKEMAFQKELAAISRHPAFGKPEIKALFKFGSGFDWVSFITECKNNLPQGFDETLVAEAFMSEFGKQDFNPAEMDVGRLRRLVVNKFRVEPSEVPGMPTVLAAGDMALFQKACALTPAGAGYYAAVKAKYEELKG